MRAVLSFGILGLVLSFASPASAQMCGAGQGATAGASASGGMCGGGSMGQMGQSAADDPMADKPAQPRQSSMGCACCKNMAMMRPQGGQSMPGMDMPKQ